MKKRYWWIAGGIAVLVVMLYAGLRRPSGDEVALLRDVQPFAETASAGTARLPNLDIRYYSLHMPYDEAVTKLAAELGPKGRGHTDYYGVSMFLGRPGSKEWIQVYRSKVLTGSPIVMKRKMMMAPDQKDPKNDPTGWVKIVVARSVSSARGLSIAVGKKFSGEEPVSFRESSPLPKVGNDAQRVNVLRGTSQLEGSVRAVSVFTPG